MMKPRTLPGELSYTNQRARMLRVNHAGEYGAKQIYAGQLAVLKNSETAPVIQHMAEQEQQHLDYFNHTLPEYQVRPSALLPLWHVAGFALGAATALLGEKAAMACTVAVEEVIDAHYQSQLADLQTHDPALAEKVEQFRQEELEHRDTGLHHHAEDAPAYHLLKTVIQTGSRAAIWLASRV